MSKKEVSRTIPFLIQEPDAKYREQAKEYLTSHGLAEFRRCPELFRRRKLGLIKDEDRPAYRVGRGTHSLALEGENAFHRTFAVGGITNPRTGKPFGPSTQAHLDWVAEQEAMGKGCLTDDQYELVTNMAQAVKAHPFAPTLLAEGVAEGVVRTEYCGVKVQSRLDWFNPERGLLDLKTCDDLSYFEVDAKRYSYGHQMAFYRAVVERVTGTAYPVHFIAVEKKQPFRCGVWIVSDQTLAHCQRENEAAIERLKECAATDTWPLGFEETRVLEAI